AGTFLYAGDVSRFGTTSGVQLLIPVGARSIALGAGVVSSVRGAEAIAYNPAGMSMIPKSELIISTMRYIADINHNYVAGTVNGGRIGTFGFSIKSVSFGKIDETTEVQPDGTGNTYSPVFIVGGLSYSRLLTDRITAGVTGKYIFEGVMQTSASTFALDFGVQYAFNNSLRLGVVMQNVGGKLKYAGRNLERPFQIPASSPDADDGYFEGVALASDIPSLFSFGLSYAINIAEYNSVELIGSFVNQNDAPDQLSGGLEYDYRNLFFLRGGYMMNAQNQDDNIFGYSVGAGLKYGVGNFDFQFDYAFRQLTDYFDPNHVFAFIFGL
ncbi:MAG: PorV/PorQ family protein, partial [Calditrichia bacterium]|nr:PorV/PorQ family protein [Calditrichia bacterium]